MKSPVDPGRPGVSVGGFGPRPLDFRLGVAGKLVSRALFSPGIVGVQVAEASALVETRNLNGETRKNSEYSCGNLVKGRV